MDPTSLDKSHPSKASKGLSSIRSSKLLPTKNLPAFRSGSPADSSLNLLPQSLLKKKVGRKVNLEATQILRPGRLVVS